MKTLIALAVIAATCLLGAGAWIVIVSKSYVLLSPNAFLRLADTLLLFAIVLMLFTGLVEKKQ